MKLLDLLRGRASARSFDGRAIPQEVLEQVLESTSYSPRAGNLQHFSIRVIEDKSELARASQIFFNCKITAEASALLIFFVDQKSTSDYLRSEETEYPFANLIGYHYALADAIVAMQTAAITAESLGLVTRFLSASLQRAKAVAQAFAAPEGVIPVFSLAIGFETEKDSSKRHNLPWQTYTSRGFHTPWPSWETIYLKSGKAEEELRAQMAMPSVSAQVERDPSLSSTAKILGRVRYSAEDLGQLSRELREMLQNLFK